MNPILQFKDNFEVIFLILKNEYFLIGNQHVKNIIIVFFSWSKNTESKVQLKLIILPKI